MQLWDNLYALQENLSSRFPASKETEIQNYNMHSLAFIASYLRVTNENLLFETDLSRPLPFFLMFSLLLKELIFIFLFSRSGFRNLRDYII